MLCFSPNEEVAFLEKERNRLRKLRLVQVREQEKKHSLLMRQKYKKIQSNVSRELIENARNQWDEKVQSELAFLENELENRMNCLGSAHHAAQDTIDSLYEQGVTSKNAWDLDNYVSTLRFDVELSKIHEAESEKIGERLLISERRAKVKANDEENRARLASLAAKKESESPNNVFNNTSKENNGPIFVEKVRPIKNEISAAAVALSNAVPFAQKHASVKSQKVELSAFSRAKIETERKNILREVHDTLRNKRESVQHNRAVQAYQLVDAIKLCEKLESELDKELENDFYQGKNHAWYSSSRQGYELSLEKAFEEECPELLERNINMQHVNESTVKHVNELTAVQPAVQNMNEKHLNELNDPTDDKSEEFGSESAHSNLEHEALSDLLKVSHGVKFSPKISRTPLRNFNHSKSHSKSSSSASQLKSPFTSTFSSLDAPSSSVSQETFNGINSDDLNQDGLHHNLSLDSKVTPVNHLRRNSSSDSKISPVKGSLKKSNSFIESTGLVARLSPSTVSFPDVNRYRYQEDMNVSIDYDHESDDLFKYSENGVDEQIRRMKIMLETVDKSENVHSNDEMEVVDFKKVELPNDVANIASSFESPEKESVGLQQISAVNKSVLKEESCDSNFGYSTDTSNVHFSPAKAAPAPVANLSFDSVRAQLMKLLDDANRIVDNPKMFPVSDLYSPAKPAPPIECDSPLSFSTNRVRKSPVSSTKVSKTGSLSSDSEEVNSSVSSLNSKLSIEAPKLPSWLKSSHDSVEKPVSLSDMTFESFLLTKHMIDAGLEQEERLKLPVPMDKPIFNNSGCNFDEVKQVESQSDELMSQNNGNDILFIPTETTERKSFSITPNLLQTSYQRFKELQKKKLEFKQSTPSKSRPPKVRASAPSFLSPILESPSRLKNVGTPSPEPIKYEEMRKRTERFYNRLPEVISQRLMKQKEKDLESRKLKAKELDNRIRASFATIQQNLEI